MAYVASFYMTICLHITPIKLSGKVLDLFMLLEYKAIDHLLIGMIQSYKERIINAEGPNQVLEFFKFDLMKESLKGDNIGSFINSKSLNLLLEGNN